MRRLPIAIARVVDPYDDDDDDDDDGGGGGGAPSRPHHRSVVAFVVVEFVILGHGPAGEDVEAIGNRGG